MQSIELWIEQARQLEKNGQVTEAFMLLKHAFHQDKMNFRAAKALGDLAFETENFEAACSFYWLAVSLDPGDAEVWQFLAKSLSAISKDAEAMEAEALALAPEDVLTTLRLDTLNKLTDSGELRAADYLMTTLDKQPNLEEILSKIKSRIKNKMV